MGARRVYALEPGNVFPASERFSYQGPFYQTAMLAVLSVVAAYVVLLVFSKAIRVSRARGRYVARMSAGHLGDA